jgi:AcrR family transcriptional regulator
MGRKSVKKKRNTNPLKREKYVKLLMPIFQQHGLNKFTMDDMAAELGISKATLYHHFSSKDEIISSILKHILFGIKEFEPIVLNESLPFIDRYFRALQILSENTQGISNIFLTDLKDGYPQLWTLVDQFSEHSIQILKSFYDAGKRQGYFNDVHTAILAASDRMFFHTLSDPTFLMENNMTLQQAFEEYFKLKCFGLIPANNQQQIDRVHFVLSTEAETVHS